MTETAVAELKATPGPVTIHAKDYRPPAFHIERIDLDFDLRPHATHVKSRLHVVRHEAGASLKLDGQNLKLIAVCLDGREITPTGYTLTPDQLILADVPDDFTLEIETEIDPAGNTALEGLYMSHGLYCTQCEAEGFRKITYYPDRPDVMAKFSVRIAADEATCPVLLSNGNKVGAGKLPNGRHWAKWDDPFPKPSYLFALVAGSLASLDDEFVTRSGRKVALHIHVVPRDLGKCRHAMESLKHAMKWDEDVFGLEYDLDLFNIVAVSHFNMGAMENKSLNIFNTKCVLAEPKTATDADFAAVEGVVAHEYFHNWTGNRVTCRDWFQLSLKEGLTVFRDQEFSADMGSRALKRISDVRTLRAHQFVEDAGPMAHPIRPDSYIEINNFYTATVYEKGAEVIRMMHTLLGPQNFRKGMDLYFKRHDGEAVTCADFVAAMEDASGIDLTQFRLWYEQAGTPRLDAQGRYDAASRTYDLTVEQTIPPTPGQPLKKPMHMPLSIGLLSADGRDMVVTLDGGATSPTHVLGLKAARQSFRFRDVPEPPVPSLNRGFAAPVRLDAHLTRADLAFLMAHDSDPFARFEAGQELAVAVLVELVAGHQAGRKLQLADDFAKAFGAALGDHAADKAFLAELLALPSEAYLAQRMDVIDVDAIHAARLFLRTALTNRFVGGMTSLYHANLVNEPYAPEPGQAGRRAFKNLLLSYLVEAGGKQAIDLAQAQFHGATNMTDEIAALAALSHCDCLAWDSALQDFHRKWAGEALVIDKWFTVQALSPRADTLERVIKLTGHPDFDIANPNRLRALINAFAAMNQPRFHDDSGRGYQFLRQMVEKIDARNPQAAARMVAPLSRWRRYDAKRQALMKAELNALLGHQGLSNDVYEIVSKALK